MKTMKKTALALIAVSALATGAYLALRPGADTSVSKPRSGSAAARTLRFPAGVALDYRLELEQRSVAEVLSQGQIAALTRLAGVLRFSSAGEGLVAVEFVELDRDELSVNGQDALEEASRLALRTRPFYLALETSGRIDQVSFEPESPETFVRLAQLLASELRFELDAGAAWSRSEPSLHGQLATEYRASGHGTEHQLTRRATLQSSAWAEAALPVSIEGGRTATWHEDGRFLSLAAKERFELRDESGAFLQSVETKLELRFVGESKVPARARPALAPLMAKRPSEIAVSDRAERRALEQRIDGLTVKELESNLALAMVGGQAPDHNRFLWRASGLIEQDSGAIEPMKPLFRAPTTTHAGRALILDLLVGAGTEAAQAALIQLIDSPIVDADPLRVHLRQRLALLPTFAPETVRFLEEKARSEDPWHEPARIALGAAAHALRAQGEEETAARLGAYLVKTLEQATMARAIEVLLMALGNTKDPAYESAIVAHAGHVEGSVRFAVADALRAMPSDGAETTLLSLVADQDPEVSRKAIDTLRERLPLGVSAWGGIMASLEAERIPPTALPELATLCGEEAKVDGPARRVLERMVLSPNADVNLRARVRRMLQR